MKTRFLGVARKPLVQNLCLLIAALVFAPALMAKPAPWWWTNPSTQIWDGSTEENNYPINVGQLKYVATQAKAYLDSVYSDLDWNIAYFGSGITNPFPFSVASPEAEDYAPANVGQLKAIAYGFYKVLHTQGYDTASNIIQYGGTPSQLNGIWVPWEATAAGEDYAPANVGQLKLVFAFASLWNPTDADGNGFPDAWEEAFFGATGASFWGDADGDGLSNYMEYLLGTDPSVADSDAGALSGSGQHGASGQVVIVLGPSLVTVESPEEGEDPYTQSDPIVYTVVETEEQTELQ